MLQDMEEQTCNWRGVLFCSEKVLFLNSRISRTIAQRGSCESLKNNRSNVLQAPGAVFAGIVASTKSVEALERT